VKPPPFEYVAARSPEEALDALAAGGEDAKPIAGGQSLVPALNMRLVRPSLLVDLNRAGLDRLERADDEVRVGATVRQAALERSPLAHPLARAALPHVGHVATRARGTVGGSVAHADGAAELPLCLLAAGGRAVVDGPSGRREVEADDLFVTHYLTTLAPGELLVETVWPVPPDDAGHAFEEQALRAGDYALAMAAVSLRRRDGAARDVRVAVGAVVDRPMLLPEAAAALEGAEVDAGAAREAGAAAAAAVDPTGSVHASAAYLRHLAGVLVERAALRAWEDAP
jgi:carbon-monoxide dehydrogenase medium subunit